MIVIVSHVTPGAADVIHSCYLPTPFTTPNPVNPNPAVGSHHPHGYYGPAVSAAASYGPPGAHAAGGAYYSLPPPPTSPYATHVGVGSHPAGHSSVNDRGMLGHPHY